MNDFLSRFDEILETSNLDKAVSFIKEEIVKSINEKDTAKLFTILNEAIGFFRDTTALDLCLSYSDSLYNLLLNTTVDDKLYEAINYINLANAYRACKKFSLSLCLSDKAIDIFNTNNLEKDHNFAALLNNKALTYQMINEDELAIKLLKEALNYNKDDIKTATTYVNLASSYLRLNDTFNACNYLLEAKTIFDTDSEYDFHYMGYLKTYALYNYVIKNYQESMKSYELSLAYISKFVGFTTYYYETLNEYYNVLDILKINHHTPLLKLNKEYYETFAKELEKYSNIVVGSFGYGSHNYMLDDKVSNDHDYEPGFIILVKDNDTLMFDELTKFYESLPKIFKRFYLKNESKRHGVFYFSDYLNHVGYFERDNEIAKSRLLNGEIYLDKSNLLINLQNELKNDYNINFYSLLVKAVLEFGQIAQYNTQRMVKRNDLLSAMYLENQLANICVRICHILNKKYMIHNKFHLAILKDFKYYDIFYNYIKCVLTRVNTKEITEKFISDLLYILKDHLLIKNVNSLYIEDYKDEMLEFVNEYSLKHDLIKKIIDIEYDMFDKTKNIGSRASCQDNYPVFSLMRKSQYYTFNMSLLQSYYEYLNTAILDNHNIITYKYAYMEESTDNNHFKLIKDYLPTISSYKKNVVEEIIKIVLDDLLIVLNKYPNLVNCMRNVFTINDSIDDTSYETYLRGELYTYSDDLLTQYAKFIVINKQSDVNIVYNPMFYNAFFQDLEIIDL